MNDSRDFQDAESVRSGQSHVTSQNQCFFLTSSKSWRNAKPFSGNAELQQWAAKYLGHASFFGNVFANPTASSSARYPQESNPWISNVSEHTSPHVMQSGPSTRTLRNDDIQEFDSKWDGILLSMTKIPSDDILEGLYKLRIRECEKLKTVLELCDLEIHQKKKAGPDHHRLKTMGKEKSSNILTK